MSFAPTRGPSFWLDYDYQPRPALADDVEVDVIIIGGGLCGVSAALHTRRQGFSVALVEAKSIAFGATGRNAGFILAGVAERHSRVAALHGRQKAAELWALTLENHRRMAEEIRRQNIPCFYQDRGSIQLSSSGSEDAELQASAQLLNEDGFGAQYLAAHETPEVYQKADFGGALLIPDDGALDPARFVRGLAKIAEAEGVRIFEGSPVVEMDTHQEGDVWVRCPGGKIQGAVAFLCTNADARALHGAFQDRVDPNRGQMLATAPVAPLFDRPVYANHGFEYWRQTESGQIVIGGWRYLDVEGEEGNDDRIHPEIQGAMETFLARFPQLKGIEITHRWSGVMGFSKDGLPLVGAVPNQKGMLAAVGFTGHGFGFAYLAGHMLSQLVTEGKSQWDHLLSPRRQF